MKNPVVASLCSLIISVLFLTSCSAPVYLPCPRLRYPTIENRCTFGIQNMDEKAKVEESTLTCHYEGFDVEYKILQSFIVSMVIKNNSNKSLIIDKSKCFVLYDGYSTQLFKDVRSSRSTTFNNVHDAIDNVQTNESSVSMTIPPYSKWELPLQETNLREIKNMPDFRFDLGTHPLTSFDNNENVEYVIPYSYDYSLAKWNTIRNRIYVNSIEVKNGFTFENNISEAPKWLSNNQYLVTCRKGEPDYSEAKMTDELNKKIYKRHKRQVIIADILCFPFTAGWSLLCAALGGCYNEEHYPPVYNRVGYDPHVNNDIVIWLGGTFTENVDGVVVTSIVEGELKTAGVTPGFVISEIESIQVKSVNDMLKAITDTNLSGKKEVWIRGTNASGRKCTFVVEP